ncbi:MAG: chromosomal replication initiator protein DnaA [Spirochaetaceae bacterium]|jgi:chromosomal replication initiator protein|nr:chromosomal replication initiator protein DnaA [Spirochaetaceae bacterium]
MPENSSHELIWNETLNQIKGDLEEQEFLTWFNLEFLNADENTFTVSVPSAFYLDQVTKRYKSYIEGKIEELIGKKTALTLVIKPKNPEKESQAAIARQKPDSSGAKNSAEKAVPAKKSPHSQLRPDYTFESYIIGDNNSFAANAAQAIARNPGTAYNPFLIYGGAGLGKTHLMQAIGNYIHENSNISVIYVFAETFTNEFIAAINGGERAKAAFKNKYRYADVLLIDDIHFLQDKQGTQEELFYTFNALSDANKQMVFTCDRPVSELKNFNERLRSRVGKGLNVDLQPPNYETRCAILRKKAETIGIDIPDEVIALVSKNISTNVRDLESALNTLSAYVQLLGKPITLGTAQERLKDMFASPRQANMSMETIQRVVAEEFHLSLNDLKGKKKTQNIVYPRQLAMFIIREITEYTTTEIGQAFGGRDHTTVMHACQKIEERIKAEPSMDSTIQSLIRAVKDYSAKS